MKKITFISIVSLALYMSACKEKEEIDSEKPVFKSVKINSIEQINATSETEVITNESFSAAIELSDNIELSQLKVEVHENFDGHSHAKIAIKAIDTFAFNEVYTLSGKTATKTINFWTNSNEVQNGEYHLELQALDKSGNNQVYVVPFDITTP